MAEYPAEMKLYLLLMAALISGCVIPNSHVRVRSRDHSSLNAETDIVKLLWSEDGSGCKASSIEILSLKQLAAATKTWGAYKRSSNLSGYVETRVLSLADTRYPDEMLRQGIKGGVLVLLLVDEHGKVADARAVCATRMEFVEPALEAARKYRYQPAQIQGTPVKVTVLQPMNFWF